MKLLQGSSADETFGQALKPLKYFAVCFFRPDIPSAPEHQIFFAGKDGPGTKGAEAVGADVGPVPDILWPPELLPFTAVQIFLEDQLRIHGYDRILP